MMKTYEVSSEPYEECVEWSDGHPRYETTAFYEIIEAESRSKARYKALKKLGISDFRDAPKLSVRLYKEDASEHIEEEHGEEDLDAAQRFFRRWNELEDSRPRTIHSLLEEEVRNLTNELATYKHKASYYEHKYLSLSSRLTKLIPYRMVREMLGLA